MLDVVIAVSTAFLDNIRDIVLFAGVAVALRSIWNFRDVAKKKEALAMLMNMRNDSRLKESLRMIDVKHIDKDYDIEKLGYDYDKLSEDEQKDRLAICYALNHYEYVAVGIHRSIYCEDLIKDASCSTILNLYDQTKPFIKKIREQKKRDTIYQEIEKLSLAWKDSPLKENGSQKQ